MKLKLDENLGRSVVEQLCQAGFDVTTVAEQNMRGAADDLLIEVCKSEQRCLVTLDKGYANPLQYRPTEYAGLVVIRLPRRQLFADLQSAVKILISGMKKRAVNGQLWIVLKDRIRQYQPDNMQN